MFRGGESYLHFIFDSTISRSLKSIPHGFPGVASSMNRPNSGWNVGRGSFLHTISRFSSTSLLLQFLHSLLQPFHGLPLGLLSLFRKRIEQLRLSQRQAHLLFFLIDRNDEVFDLYSRAAQGVLHILRLAGEGYLVSPEERISLLALGLAPDIK